MPRQIEKTVILAKLETTYGTDATPVGASDAILVSSPQPIPLQANNVDRALVRGYFGGSEQLVGTASKAISFDVELAGSGTPTTPTQWGRLLQACGFSQTIGAASVDYLPTSTFGASSSLTIYYQLDGEQHKLLGARGTFSIAMGVGERPLLRFRFVGLDGGSSAVSNATPTFTAYQVPLVVTDQNSSDVLLGATYTGATGVISSGTAYPSRGLTLDVNNRVAYQALLGGETVEITGRDVNGNISFDLTAAQAVSFLADVKANTTTSLGFTHGVSAGNIIGIFGSKVQRVDPTIEDLEGRAMSRYNTRFVPNTGNDELRIITR